MRIFSNKKIKLIKITAGFVLVCLIFAWIFSGWPPLYFGQRQFPPNVNEAAAVVTPNGRLYYGDATNTAMKFRNNIYDFDFTGAEQTYTHGASSSLIRFIVAKPAVTRDEVMVGILKADGQLTVIKGINGYDVNTDYSTPWSTAVNNAMTCEGTEADCTRAFDIAYERLSGRAMVVYAGDSQDAGTVIDNQKLFYCYYDGTNWGPVSNCAPTTGSNDITLSSNGRPTFVSIKPKGGSNELLMGVGIDVAGTHEVEAYRWTGSTWTDQVVATDTTNASSSGNEQGAVFDVEWESNTGDALVIYATIATVEIKYKLLPSGSTWGSEQDGYDTNVNGASVIWMNAEGDPQSDRIAVATNDTSNDFRGAVWKNDGSATGFTVLATDATLEGGAGTTAGPAYTDVQWEQSGSEFIFLLMDAGAGDTGSYIRYACTGSGCSVATAQSLITTTGLTDDAQMIRTAASRNSDDIMVLLTDIDNNLITQHWNGSAWESGDAGVLEAALSLCSADNVATGCSAMPAAFTYIPYSAWSRNWKFFQGTDTTDTPTNQLANENTTPTDFTAANGKFRLRFSVTELSGMDQADARKKLQYTTGDPDSLSTTWTDVDDPAGTGAVWRYVDCNGGSSVCDDNTTLGGTTLSGSPTAGWWTQDKDAAGGSVMDHAALQLRELEYSVEAYSAATSTTYYFRMYDVDQGKPVRREQDNDGNNDCATATCTYPSLTTAAAAAGPDVTAPASVSMSSYQLGGVGYNDYTFAAGELVAVTNSGSSGWSLTVSSTNMTGTKNTITNANILLRTDGTLATEPTIITSSDSLTGVTEAAADSYSLDSIRTIVSASAGNGIGTYNVRPTIRVNINNYGTYAETDTATLTFTVQ